MQTYRWIHDAIDAETFDDTDLEYTDPRVDSHDFNAALDALDAIVGDDVC